VVNKVQTLHATLDEKQLKALKGYVDEIVVCMTRVKSTNESMSDIIGLAHDELKLPKKLVRRIAKVQYSQSLQEEVAEFKDFEALVESLNEVK
jgi:hypothetical protein